MAKVKKFAMGGMNLNRSSIRPPPAPVRPPPQAGQPAAIANLQRAISGTPVGLAGMGAAMRSGSGLTPMPVARQSQQSPMSSGSMMGAFNQPIARASGQPVQVPNTSGTPAGLAGYQAQLSGLRNNGQPVAAQQMSNVGTKSNLGSLSGMKKGGTVKSSTKSSASKRGDGIAQRGKTRGKLM